VKRVGSGVDSDKPEPVVDRVEKSLLALRGHRRIFVGAFLREIAGREKHNSGVLMKFLGVEDAAIFRCGEIEFILS